MKSLIFAAMTNTEQHLTNNNIRRNEDAIQFNFGHINFLGNKFHINMILSSLISFEYTLKIVYVHFKII